MRILTYNVHGWRTADDRPNLDGVAAAIAASAADIIGLNEVFHPAGPGEGAPLANLAARLGLHYVFGPARPAAGAPSHPPYGNALLSRWPIQAFAAHHLSPETPYGRRGLLEARLLLPGGRPLTIYVTHLDHRSEDIRLAQWAAASTWLQRERGRPHVLLGDFNALAEADYAEEGALARLVAYQQARGWPAPRFELIAQVLKAGYVDAQAHASGGPAPSFPAADPERRIDYIFLPQALAGALRASARFDAPAVRTASDHLPVMADLAWL